MWVYGSLRREEFNNYILKGSEYLGRGIVRGYKMYSLGSYPFVVSTGNPNDKIFVEGFEVDRNLANSVANLEYSAGYHIDNVDIEIELGSVIEGKIFAMEIIHRNCGEIKSGDWTKSKSERYLSGYYS